MKKMFLALTIVLINAQCGGFCDLQSTTRKIAIQDNQDFLNEVRMPVDEYTYYDNGSAIEEYDQNVSDNVQPPKICPAKELVARILGSLLVHYFNIQQWTCIQFEQFKGMLAKWYLMASKAF